MVAESNGHVRLAALPDLPSADATRRGAQAREDTLPPLPVKVTEGDSPRVPRMSVPWVRTVLTGGSLLAARPPSLAEAWTRHRQSAAHYNAGLVRWPRYAWGALHVALKAALHVVEWVTDSPPKLITAAAVVAACWFWSSACSASSTG